MVTLIKVNITVVSEYRESIAKYEAVEHPKTYRIPDGHVNKKQVNVVQGALMKHISFWCTPDQLDSLLQFARRQMKGYGQYLIDEGERILKMIP